MKRIGVLKHASLCPSSLFQTMNVIFIVLIVIVICSCVAMAAAAASFLAHAEQDSVERTQFHETYMYASASEKERMRAHAWARTERHMKRITCGV
ncbi:MAG: hypothetical protein Q7V62_15215 [Actinomycetota bacterium]|nr:hypothetical protein [Actinomycetota bacterium]